MGVGRGGGRSVGRLLVLGGVGSIAVVDLDTHLLGQSKLDGLAGGVGQTGHALLSSLGHILDLGHGDALLLGEVLAGDPGQADGLVDAGLDGLGVGHVNGGLHNGDNGDVVAGLLGNLLAVVVAVALVAVAVAGGLGLADGDHLGLALLLEGDLDGLGGGGLGLGLVGVGADLVVNLLDGLSADGPGDVVALLLVDDALPGQLDGVADGLEGGGAHLGGLNNVLHGAVVLGVLIAVGGGGVAIGGGRVAVGRGRVAIGGGRVAIGGVGGLVVGLSGDTRGQGDQDEESESLQQKEID